ncbi:hypothetical protein HDU97_008738 [Phlyctochytrium planicorne]|nr:hypothetical protein HDU97_008738 [Phlyctochytrium planicorne]
MHAKHAFQPRNLWHQPPPSRNIHPHVNTNTSRPYSSTSSSSSSTSSFPPPPSQGIHFWTGFAIGASGAVAILGVSSFTFFILLRSGYFDSILELLGDGSTSLLERYGIGLFAAGAGDGRWSLPVVIGDISDPNSISEEAITRKQAAQRKALSERDGSNADGSSTQYLSTSSTSTTSAYSNDQIPNSNASSSSSANASSFDSFNSSESSNGSSPPSASAFTIEDDDDANTSDSATPTTYDWMTWWASGWGTSSTATTTTTLKAPASEPSGPKSSLDEAELEETTSSGKPTSRVHRLSGRREVGSFIADAVEVVLDSVVNITTETESSSTFRKRSIVSSGSGFFINEDGTILTNAHVVADINEDSKLTVTTSDGRVYRGRVHSLDVLSDLAVVKIIRDPREPHEPWKPVRFGSSKEMRPGDWVMAIGSPFGLQNTVTAGIVSSRRRKSTEIGGKDSRVEYIQTDCVIHSGSSGGPLINLDGEVVGINTTRAESEGISFAIRIDTSLSMIRQLVERGRISRPWLGFRMVSLSPPVWQQLRSKGPDEFLPKVDTGVLITSVVKDSPAGVAGCEEGDVIVKVNEQSISTTSEIYQLIGLRVGEPIRLCLKRNVPVDMDWDGRPRGCESVEVHVTVNVEELDPTMQQHHQ